MTRLCEGPDCGASLEGKRRGTRFCSRSCADKARYQDKVAATEDEPKPRRGRPPQGEQPKPASWFRQGRRVEAKDTARAVSESRALMDELARKVGVVLPPEPGPEYEWISSPTWREDRARWEAMRDAYWAAAREAGLRLKALAARGGCTPHDAFVFSIYCHPRPGEDEAHEDLLRAWRAKEDALEALADFSQEDREALLSDEDRALLAEYEREKAMEYADWRDRKRGKDPFGFDID
jgi:hypothetical protein